MATIFSSFGRRILGHWQRYWKKCNCRYRFCGQVFPNAAIRFSLPDQNQRWHAYRVGTATATLSLSVIASRSTHVPYNLQTANYFQKQGHYCVDEAQYGSRQ